MTSTQYLLSHHFHGPSIWKLFLGRDAPSWYKAGLLISLLANVGLYFVFGSFVVGWVLLAEFIVTLAMAKFAFPLFPGGLLLMQAMALGLVSPEVVNGEIFNKNSLQVLFLVLFVVTGVHFLKELLSFLFIKAILFIKSEVRLGIFFLLTSAVLSALLDALTTMAVVATVVMLLYDLYHRYASEVGQHHEHNLQDDKKVREDRHQDLLDFRASLRRLIMVAAIGTMLGGITTKVGEPQNMLIAEMLGWDFIEFFTTMLPVSLATIIAGVGTCMLVDKLGWFGFGRKVPLSVRLILEEEVKRISEARTPHDYSRLTMQTLGAAGLVIGLIFHLAEVYIVGLMLLVFLGSFLGADEHEVGEALREGGPFVAVLAVFFGIVAMIHEQHLFAPVSDWVLSFDDGQRLLSYFAATGLLSAGSDNVFVASLFMSDAYSVHQAGELTRQEIESIAVAINMGTNIPSVATPNGQAAFLFLLMHKLSPIIRLTYLRMMVFAFPFAIVCSVTAAAAVWMFY